MVANRSRIQITVVVSILTLFLAFSLIGEAQARPRGKAAKYEGLIIKAIEVEGNKSVDEWVILSAVKSKVGDRFCAKDLRRDLKEVYNLELFSDVQIDATEYQGGVRIKFLVVERLIVGRINFKGNRRLKDDEIAHVIDMAPGQVFTQSDVPRGEAKVLSLYKEKGYTLASVNGMTEVSEEPGRVDIFFEIEEGHRIKIAKVFIEGNEVFKDRKIRKVMETRRRRIFSEETFREDLRRIVTFYRNHGYTDAKIVSSDKSFDEQKKRMFIKVVIDEGPQVMVGKIEIGSSSLFTLEEIEEVVGTKSGDIFNEARFDQDLANIHGLYAQRGHPFARIIPDLSFDEKKEKVFITLNIQEGPLVHLGEIGVEGSQKTKEKVIRRELTVKPGEVFDSKKILRSREKVYNLGYFKEVNLDTRPGIHGDSINLTFSVEEQKTGTLTFGAGYSSVDKLVGYIDVAENNLFGTGRKAALKWEFGSKRENYEFSFTEPWLFDTPTSFGFNIYNTTRDRDDYEEARRGGSIRLGRPITDFTRIYLRYRYEGVEISDVLDTAPQVIKDLEEKASARSLTPSVVRDSRDNVFDASRGSYLGLSVEYMGGFLGGDYEFTKYNLDSRWYHKTFWKFVLALRLKAGIAQEFGDSTDVPYFEKFYCGGAETVRGYEYREVGPKEEGTPIGGKALLVANMEWRFPIAKHLKGVLFIDGGDAWNSEVGGAEEDDFDLKFGAGIGIRFSTPIGPIRLDYGYALNPEPGQADSQFYFSMGQMF